MLKKLVLKLINAVFGLNLTEGDLDAFIAFIKMLIEVFGSISGAVSFARSTVRKARSQDPNVVRLKLEGLEKTLGD